MAALGIQHPLLQPMAAEVIYIAPHFHLFLKWLNQCLITLLRVAEIVLHCYNGFTFS
jgi:hypothetical protein